MSQLQIEAQNQENRSKARLITITVVTTALVIALGAYVWVTYLFPSEFKPVTLSEKEAVKLDQKLKQVNLQELSVSTASTTSSKTSSTAIQPEPYRENEALRRVSFSEREVNAMLAHNTDLADKVAIDFSDDLASAKWLIPLDPEFPVLGGKTLKLTAGIELAYRHERPVVKLRGVSLWGVPLPDAWLGYNKNIDLVSEFGSSRGFWSAFADGVDDLSVSEGELVIQLSP